MSISDDCDRGIPACGRKAVERAVTISFSAVFERFALNPARSSKLMQLPYCESGLGELANQESPQSRSEAEGDFLIAFPQPSPNSDSIHNPKALHSIL